MAQIVIEATSEAQRTEYQKTAEYSAFIEGAVNITEGVTFDNVSAKGDTVDIYWLLIENEKDEDNATYRIDDEGVAVFSASGVEV